MQFQIVKEPMSIIEVDMNKGESIRVLPLMPEPWCICLAILMLIPSLVTENFFAKLKFPL